MFRSWSIVYRLTWNILIQGDATTEPKMAVKEASLIVTEQSLKLQLLFNSCVPFCLLKDKRVFLPFFLANKIF